MEKKLAEYKKKDPDILGILLLRKNEESGRWEIMASSSPEDRTISIDTYPIYKDKDFSIEEGRLNGKLTRLFSLYLKDEYGKVVGMAQVYLRADRISRVKNAFAKSILAVCLAGIILGVIFTFGVVKYLTLPLTSLLEDIRIVSSGNLEHRTVPKSHDEIGVLAVTFDQMTQRLRIAKEEELKKKALEHELEIATEIQTKLLPERIPQIPGYDIFIYYLSAKHVGGDYYDFIFIDKEHLGIVVADVSGKGIPGSMVMTMTRSLLRLAARGNPSPADALKKVNRILAQDMKRGMFVTASYSVLNVRTRRLTVASAGHNPLVIYRAQTRDIELVKPQGIALGFDKGQIFDSHIVEQVIQLHRGDRMVAYTDGVVEAMNERDEEFGDETFYKLTRQYGHKSSKEYIQTVVRALEKHRGKAEQSDDITITTIRVE